MLLFTTRPVIGPYPLNVFIPVGSDIIFVALFAFVYVAVKHLRVLIKVLQRLDGVALKTFFRTNHVELQWLWSNHYRPVLIKRYVVFYVVKP